MKIWKLTVGDKTVFLSYVCVEYCPREIAQRLKGRYNSSDNESMKENIE